VETIPEHISEALPRRSVTTPRDLVRRSRGVYGWATSAALIASTLFTASGCADTAGQANLLVESGLVAAQREQYDRAFELFAEAERVHPGHVAAIVASGELAIDRGDYARADAELSRAIALDPATVLWREKRATVRQLAGRYDESLADYDAVIAAEPENSAALYNRGALLAQRGNKAAAAVDLERAFRDRR
jgi:tetratricopeptide (TPR) repeat protein